MLRNAKALLLRSYIGPLAIAYIIGSAILSLTPMFEPLYQRLAYGFIDQAFRPPIPHQSPDPFSPRVLLFDVVRLLGFIATSWIFARWLYGPAPFARVFSRLNRSEEK